MNPIPELAPRLKQLRLSGILDSLEARNRQAIDSKLAYTEFLALLIQDEVAPRAEEVRPAHPPSHLHATGKQPRLLLGNLVRMHVAPFGQLSEPRLTFDGSQGHFCLEDR